MGILELFVIALGLSADAFAVSVCKGLSVERISFKNILAVGFYFGGFQGGMESINKSWHYCYCCGIK